MRFMRAAHDDTGAVARGTALVAAAVLLGIVVLQATDEDKSTFPSRSKEAPASTTTLPTGGGGDARGSSQPGAAAQVLVLNGSGRAGEAAKLTERLDDLGFRMLSPDDAPRQVSTKVYFAEGHRDEAFTVAAAVNETGTSPPLEQLPNPPTFNSGDADIVIVIGTQTG